jgi:hypothetical protein
VGVERVERVGEGVFLVDVHSLPNILDPLLTRLALLRLDFRQLGDV